MTEDLRFENRGVVLRAVAAGDENYPVVLLLHGFPEFSFGWRKQIEPLAHAGFRVIALDQRGYNDSGKPAGIAAYRMSELVSDILAVADQLGVERLSLVGHDWGGGVAWNFAARHPARIARLAILNCPHPAVMLRRLRRDWRQRLRSWYMLYFQIPVVPEWLFAAADYRGTIDALRKSGRPGVFSAADFEIYKQAWDKPGALTGMINWYRAAFRYRGELAPGEITCPVQIVWGAQDQFAEVAMAEESLSMCPHGELRLIQNATHWVHLEEPELVNQTLIEFLRA